MKFDRSQLSLQENKEIERLLKISKNDPPELEDIWNLMDLVWDELGCSNSQPNFDKIRLYYQHPVWILNGIFIEEHQISLQHRNAIADWIVKKSLKNIFDFGGGLGTLARIISEKDSEILIDIYEPYTSQYAISKIDTYPNVNFINSFSKKYDCLVSTDVIEHVSNPLDLLSQMIDLVNNEGFLIIANHFSPSIKCHLPSTFHLRYSFDEFAKEMGLQIIGVCNGSNATIYKKVRESEYDVNKIKRMKLKSKLLFPFREFKQYHLVPWKNRLITITTNPTKTLHYLRSKF